MDNETIALAAAFFTGGLSFRQLTVAARRLVRALYHAGVRLVAW